VSELSKRIFTALILIVLVWAWYFHVPQPWFVWGMALIGFITTCELVLLMKLYRPSIYISTALVLWAGFALQPHFGQLLLLIFVWFLAFAATSRQTARSFADFFASVWIFAWLFAFAYAIVVTHHSETGRGLVIGACLAVWSSDIAAYFVGRRWGQVKLCPAISPGKSVEGLLGGLLFGIPVAAMIWLPLGVMPALTAILLALVAVIAGVLGDLSESSVKRMAGAKDSGRLLPGHGGVLDRIDAIIMAVPVTWVIWSMLCCD